MRKSFVIVFCAILAISFAGCESKTKSQSTESSSEQTAGVVYTCSMHPDVVSKEPGKCPVCGMDLEKKEESTQHDEMEHTHTDSTEHK
jgi:uncharacterized lipoprotein YehR (DUF1307 family)